MICSLFCALLLLSPLASSQRLYSDSFGVPGVDAEYDYIIVGGGTAGNAVAARLAENSSVTVAVVEAGGFYEQDNGNGSVIPSLAFTQYIGADPNDTQPLIDWGFVTTPQIGYNNRTFHYARGKTLGGSSARNYMLYQRGTTQSYQRWADQVGDQSFTFSNMLKYFNRGTHLTPPNNALRPANSSVPYNASSFDQKVRGPLQVSYPSTANAIVSWARVAMNAIGLSPIPGFSSGELLGTALGPPTVDPRTETRSSSQTSYLDLAMASTSIKVYTHALVKNINFSANKTATSVNVNTAGKAFTLKARKEIIVSAGTFQSPQLLMVSGIGPKSLLQQYNITVVSDLPGVGQNMQDQPTSSISYRVNVVTSSKMLNDPQYAARAAAEYLTNRTGPLTDGTAYLGFEKIPEPYQSNFSNTTVTALSQFPADWPEIEYIATNGIMGNNSNYMKADPVDGYNYGSFGFALASPLSRGNISINSSDMADPPLINPNMLSSSADAEVMLAAFKRTRDMWSTVSNLTIGPEYYPGLQISTDDEILQHIRDTALTVWHVSCTCSMGRKGDSQAVVDTKGRVFGVNKLRVVDASIFPFLPPGHPQATIYALAEKIAEDIHMAN